MGMTTLIHATCVAVAGIGVLLWGPSGSGKSDLALRLIDDGAELVGDDYCSFEQRDKALYAAPQQNIAGLLEVRGLGIIRLPYRPEALVRVVIELLPADQDPERLPSPQTTTICGVSLPVIPLNPFQMSSMAKVRLAVRLATGIIEAVE